MKRRKGLLLAADDLQVGQLVAIHHGTRQYRDFRGASLQITAINLPFVVARMVPRPDLPPFTLNVRDCVFMPVSEEFAAAQAQQTPVVPDMSSGSNSPNQG
jgi:hypothetical protein